jgi:hypothetical protein
VFLDSDLIDSAPPAGSGWVPPVASWLPSVSVLDPVPLITMDGDVPPGSIGGLFGGSVDTWPSIDGPSDIGTMGNIGTRASLPPLPIIDWIPSRPSIEMVADASPEASSSTLAPIALAAAGVALYLLLT